MPTPTNPPRPLADLFTELEAAVRAGDRARATQLEQTILQRLANEAADRAGLERRVRALTVPRVAELMTDPAFHQLADWLRQRQADVQAAVDQALDMAQQAALGTIEHTHE